MKKLNLANIPSRIDESYKAFVLPCGGKYAGGRRGAAAAAMAAKGGPLDMERLNAIRIETHRVQEWEKALEKYKGGKD